MELYEYFPLPTKIGNLFLTIESTEIILATDAQGQEGLEMSQIDLQRCQTEDQHDGKLYICQNTNLLQNQIRKTCLGALFFGHKSDVAKRCHYYTRLQEETEEFAKQISKKIFEQRKIKKIESTFQLKDIIESAVPEKFRHGRIHCATKSFQALRIAVNDELNNLIKVLPSALSVLSGGGRLVVISFHSLEDRIVKNFFKNKSQEGVIKILTPKPVTASKEEVLVNPRARSAKLRAIVKNEKVENRK
jgi:hypothetical protein